MIVKVPKNRREKVRRANTSTWSDFFFFEDKVNIIKMSPVYQLLVGKAKKKLRPAMGPMSLLLGVQYLSMLLWLKHTPTNTSNETYFSGSCC